MAIVNTHYGYCGNRAPKMAGTWVLNDKLTRPDAPFAESANFEVSLNIESFSLCTKADFQSRALFLSIQNAGTLNVYSFTDDRWTRNYKYWRFTEEQADLLSENFKTWLIANATKQS